MTNNQQEETTMEAQHRHALEKALDAIDDYVKQLDATQGLTPELVELVASETKGAFRVAWGAHVDASEAFRSQPLIIPEWVAPTVRAIVDVGEQTWVQPLAIVEQTTTGEYFIDSLFPTSDMPSDQFCVELVVTEEGLVASGPSDRHRLRLEVARHWFRPLTAFEIATG